MSKACAKINKMEGVVYIANNDQESDEKVLVIKPKPGTSGNFVENFPELSDTISSV